MDDTLSKNRDIISHRIGGGKQVAGFGVGGVHRDASCGGVLS